MSLPCTHICVPLSTPGFLNTNIAPHQNPQMANYGLMDQIAALKWIQQNIRNGISVDLPTSRLSVASLKIYLKILTRFL